MKKFYLLGICVIMIVSVTFLLSIRMLTKFEQNHSQNVEKAHVEEEDNEPAEDTTADTKHQLPEPDEDRIIHMEELPSELDVDQRNQFIQESINYADVYISVTEDGFTLSDSFVWTDDTYWFDEDPNGFARYLNLYMPSYGDDMFGIKASDSLNDWAGANTELTYCMAAAVGTEETPSGATWYVVFREDPSILVQATYDAESDTFSYTRIF